MGTLSSTAMDTQNENTQFLRLKHQIDRRKGNSGSFENPSGSEQVLTLLLKHLPSQKNSSVALIV